MRKFAIFCLASSLAHGAPALRRPDMSAEEFWQQPEVNARIDIATFDRPLMATAIFHEANRVRGELGLPLFRHMPKLDDAADLEAGMGRVYQPPSHTNPFPMIGTPLERVKFVGLVPQLVAENIALLSIYDIDPNLGVGVVAYEGKKHFVNPDSEAELKPATYRGFAAEVVKAWMESPGHRMVLINPALLYLGCSVQPSVSVLGVDNLFCVQVFFTPGKKVSDHQREKPGLGEAESRPFDRRLHGAAQTER